jgi:NADPH-dependent glutamate synthase beta subunit-like oxidoreductase/ferredoxin
MMKEPLLFPPGPGADKDHIVYEEDNLKKESSAPCQLHCPAGIDIPSFIALISHGRFEEAVEVIRRDNPFVWVCGLICPKPCEDLCQRRHLDKALCIKDLKATAAKVAMEEGAGYRNPEIKNHFDEKVAVIGSGPAGLTAAFFLAIEGYRVTVFEAMQEPGGMLVTGIPEYRLPRDVVRREIEAICELGVEIVVNTEIGKDITLDQLRAEGYKAFFLGVGAWKGLQPHLECDQDYPQVIDALTFLKDVAFGKKIKPADDVAVIGGGNAAIDAARTLVRLGCRSVSILYRRTRSEMPAHFEEIIRCAEEGVHFHQLTLPTKIVGTYGKIDTVECVMTDLGEPDDSGRRRPVPVPDSQYRMPVGAIISAVGQKPDILDYPGLGELELTDRETIRVHGYTQQTGIADVFAGGDAVTGPSMVIEAIGAGKRAATAIHRYLRGEKSPRRSPVRPRRMVEPIRTDYQEKSLIQRHEIPIIDLDRRMHSFDEVEMGLDKKAAIEEAKRCMRCDICERCGKCAEVCSEKLGHSGIEFYHAGESSVILQGYEHGLPKCIGCGTCVNICPTGALQIEDKDGERLILMCGTVVNRLDMEQCQGCGIDFVTKTTADNVKKAVQETGGNLEICLCPECRRIERAASIAGTTPDYGNPEIRKLLKSKTVC